jgi:hypothetical protein
MGRLKRDRPSILPFDKFSLGEIFRGFAPPHVFLLSVLLFMVGTVQFGLAMSLPSTVNGLGFSGIRADLLGLGPFVVGFLGVYLRTNPWNRALLQRWPLNLVTLKSASLSDRYKSRGIATALIATMAVMGYLIFCGGLSNDEEMLIG